MNAVAIDRSGSYIAVACDDATGKVYDTNGKLLNVLRGHEDSVQNIAFDNHLRMLITSSSDCTFRLWN